jgi:putative ABC transport system permease protein
MNFFQLALKQMRQRALSTWLTMLSVLLGVGLGSGVMILQRGSGKLFGQTDFGYDIIIGPPKGSPLQLTLNTVYHLDLSPGVIPYSIYADMARKARPLPGHPDYRPYVKFAIPFMVGDSYKGRRIVGTSPQMFGYDDQGNRIEGDKFQYRPDESFELAEGKMFAPRKFEAVLGSEVAETLHLHVYDDKLSPEENEQQGGAFRATHGMPGPRDVPDIHKPRWKIVGILRPTHTANDRVLFIPFISLYAIAEHEEGMIDQALLKANIDPTKIPADRIDEVLAKLGIDPQKVPETLRKKFKMRAAPTVTAATTQDVDQLMKQAAITPAPPEKDEGEDPDAYHLDENGDIVPDLPPDEWAISAILVRSRGGLFSQQLIYNFKVIDDRAAAVNPASTMREFFDTFLKPSSQMLQAVSWLVTIVAAVGILVSIYNSISARMREIAILRALGATRVKILTLICLEAGLIGFFGGVIGLLVGHALGAAGSKYVELLVGEGFNWVAVGADEVIYLVAVTLLAVVAGLVPALKAYRTPVATNLVAG